GGGTHDPPHGLGWSADTSPQYEVGWCDTVPGTVNAFGCDLYTYVYTVLDNGALRYYPERAEDVTFFWTALQLTHRPDVTESFFVPQADSAGAVVEGSSATRYLVTCPNNDALLHNARIKI